MAGEPDLERATVNRDKTSDAICNNRQKAGAAEPRKEVVVVGEPDLARATPVKSQCATTASWVGVQRGMRGYVQGGCERDDSHCCTRFGL